YIGMWKSVSGDIEVDYLLPSELLAIKMVFEELSYEEIRKETGMKYREIDIALKEAVKKGLILKPQSKIRRENELFSKGFIKEKTFLETDIFTLQWHITQACDLHCRHCYDRSERQSVSYGDALKVLDDFWRFCRNMHVRGQISFSGGNPLLHPMFFDIYKEAYDRGFILAILGNPVSEDILLKLLSIKRPSFYQVSLEGLEEHNDYIRGRGNFKRVLKFLDLLKKYNIYSMVMLTLTEENIDQVIPLGRILRNRVKLFSFNRLAMVGEGKQLRLPYRERYMKFIGEYLEECKRNPILGIKDNLINLYKYKHGGNLFGGCTGYGCGAAFNFLSLLSDGEVHACRKLPSLIGNIYEQSLEDIYLSEIAERYRRGPEACRDCEISIVCRGCLAVAYGYGMNIFKDRDPYCFKI
ncbi:MAG: selenobiotic family peptide radical SAM maturase, partial [Nitrospirae bacterium]